MTACQRGRVDEARRLIEAGADPHHNQGEALYEAAAEGHLAVVELLIEHEVKHPQALARAAENGDLPVVTLLANRWPKDVAYDFSLALRYAIEGQHEEVAKALLPHSDPTQAKTQWARQDQWPDIDALSMMMDDRTQRTWLRQHPGLLPRTEGKWRSLQRAQRAGPLTATDVKDDARTPRKRFRP